MTLVFLVFTPASVYAVIPGEDSIPGSQDAIYSIRGKDIPDSLAQTLANYNIGTVDNTLVEVVPSDLGNNSTALMVANQKGSSLTKSVIFALNDEGEPQSVSMNSIVPNADPITICGREDLFTDGSFLGIWAIQYEYNVINIYPTSRPLYAQFVCYNEGNHNFQSFRIDYRTEGREFTYPEGNDIGERTHVITVASNSPVAYRYYTNSSDALPLNRRISIDIEGVHSVTVNFRVNNRNYTWERILPIY